ncbi:MAG: biopolymer transporter ExbD [Thermoguttaceae bacterium]|nr:biopolymer transporter ExbD [Thermoguttaceae bacterium]
MKTPTLKKRNAALELNLTSMIDVIFLLLIFFVFTSDFRDTQRSGAGGRSRCAAGVQFPFQPGDGAVAAQ